MFLTKIHLYEASIFLEEIDYLVAGDIYNDADDVETDKNHGCEA